MSIVIDTDAVGTMVSSVEVSNEPDSDVGVIG